MKHCVPKEPSAPMAWAFDKCPEKHHIPEPSKHHHHCEPSKKCGCGNCHKYTDDEINKAISGIKIIQNPDLANVYTLMVGKKESGSIILPTYDELTRVVWDSESLTLAFFVGDKIFNVQLDGIMPDYLPGNGITIKNGFISADCTFDNVSKFVEQSIAEGNFVNETEIESLRKQIEELQKRIDFLEQKDTILS